MLDWLLDRLDEGADRPAVAAGALVCTYRALLEQVAHWSRVFADSGITGRVVSIEAEYGADTIAAFLAAANAGNVVVPISNDSRAHRDEFLRVAEVEYRVFPQRQADRIVPTGQTVSHAHYEALRRAASPGLVLFSSGSTGINKGAVHDLTPLLRKFAVPRHSFRTVVFLQLDHIGGVNTIFYTLANLGTAVVPPGRTPREVCEAIGRHRAELLPTSPTFLNLLLLSEEHRRHDLSSLKLITYGTEPMPAITLARIRAALPDVRLQQTYGLSELEILRSHHFFDTGDLAEADGDGVRILGRRSETINVGGNNVSPLDVENTLLRLDNVEDVTVRGEPNAVTGQIVVAHVRLAKAEDPLEFKTRMRHFCHGRLAAYQIPSRVRFVGALHSERFKKVRSATAMPVETEP